MFASEDRYIGCILGEAIGDALGMPFAEGPKHHSEPLITEFLPSRGVAPFVVPVAELGRSESEPPLAAGQWTDDTQLTLALAQTLIDEQGLFVPEAWAHKLVQWLNAAPRGAGLSSLQAAFELRTGDLNWDEAADPDGGGVGAATRVAPVALWAPQDPERRNRVAVMQAQVTHGHPDAQAAALGIAEAVALALTSGPLTVAQAPADFAGMVVDAVEGFDPRFAEMARCFGLAQRLLADDIDPASAIRALGTSGWSREAAPVALYIALRFAADPEQALVTAINSGGAADALGSIVGAILGALHGVYGLPEHWRQGVEGAAQLVTTASGLYAQVITGPGSALPAE
jgi:ADP-ribosylglycohydrolase